MTAVISAFGSYIIFVGELIRRVFGGSLRLKLVFQQMEFIGVRSFWIINLAAVMIGAVFAIQFGSIFKLFGVESMIGATASFALSKELAPVIGSFLVAGKSGSSMAAEIATMKVNEQLDAMRVMGVSPVGYLAGPRVVASMLMMPLLTAFFVITGVVASFVIGVLIFDVDVGIFIAKIQWLTKPKHIIQGLEKAFIFGGIFSTIGCFMGFSAQGGASGVGKSTTRAVVISLVLILISDFFISYAQLEPVF